MRHSIRPSLSLVSCVLLLGAILTACSGGSPTTSPTTTSMTLNVGQISNAVGFFPLYVAQQKNFIKAQGLTLNPSPPLQTGTGAKMTAAIEAGDLEVAGGGIITDAFTLSRIDAQVRLLGALTTGYFVDVVVSKRFEQQTHLTEASPLADKVKALVGKKLGITAPGSGTESLFVYLFRQFGFDEQRDATAVNLGNVNPAVAIAALSSGRVDAVAFPVPTGQVAEAKGVGDIFISPDHGDVPEMVGQLHGVIYARQQVIDAKPKAIQAFIRAIAQAEAFIHQQPAQAKILLQKYLKLDPKTAQAVFTATMSIMAQTPQISQKDYDVANQFHVKAGLIAIALPYKDVVATNTINQALSGMSNS